VGVTGAPSIDGIDIIDVLGRGASSIVYLARQTRFDRQVAVKVLDVTGQPDMVARLYVNECRTVGRLASHPNIVTVFDGDQAGDGRPYLVMEYLGGGSLADRVADATPLPVDDVLRIGVELAGALETAHRNGIVHGDVKPQNVLFGRSGQAVLGDFGIARLSSGASSRSLSVFTPLHAAPELFDGDAVTPRTDVYGLGSTLFQLLDGRPAVGESTESPLVIARRVALGDRRSLQRPDVPERLVELIHSMMDPDPAARPATALEVGETLREIEQVRDVPATALVIFDALDEEVAPPPDRAELAASIRSGGTSGDVAQTIPPPGPDRPRTAWALTTVAVVLVLGLLAGIVALLARSGPESSSAAAPEPESSAPPLESTTSTAPAGSEPTTTTPAGTVRQSTVTSLPDKATSIPGLQPNISYDVVGDRLGDSSQVLLSKLGDGVATLGPLAPSISVVEVALPIVQRLPAEGEWLAFNTVDNPECNGFRTDRFVVRGMWDKLAVYEGGQGGLRVLEFATPEQARQMFLAWSLEQGAEPGDCVGFARPFGLADPETAMVTHHDPTLDLGPDVLYNTWLQPPPPGSPEFTSVRTFLTQRGTVLLSGAIGSKGPPPDAAAMERMLRGAWAALG
jgi:serine/threonine protein kinase